MDAVLLFLSEVSRRSNEPIDPALIERVMFANNSLYDLLEGGQTIEEHFDILEATGHDMDETLEIYEENCRFLGIW